MDAVIEKWEEILQTVKSEYEVTDVPFNTWLKPLKVYEVDGKLITVVVPSEQAAIGVNYISKRYKIPLQVTICVLTGMEECEVRFVLEKDLPKKTEKNTSYDKQVQDTRYEEAHLNPKYTFDTFVVGSNNKFAQAAALAVAESPGDTYNPLFIYGGAGLGKTHLMHSIAHYIIEHDENSKVLYVTSEEFTNELIETIRNGNNSAMSDHPKISQHIFLYRRMCFFSGSPLCLTLLTGCSAFTFGLLSPHLSSRRQGNTDIASIPSSGFHNIVPIRCKAGINYICHLRWRTS